MDTTQAERDALACRASEPCAHDHTCRNHTLLASLQARLAAAQDAHALTRGRVRDLTTALENRNRAHQAAEARAERLAQYVVHKSDCPAYRLEVCDSRCSCGLMAALSPEARPRDRAAGGDPQVREV